MFLLSVLSLFLSFSFGEKYAVYFGGGEKVGTPFTLFDESFAKFTEMEKRGWKIDYFFADDRKESRALANKLIGNRVQDFTVANYEKKMTDLLAKIASGEIKKGDQLLINVDTHGGPDGKRNFKFSTSEGVIGLEQLKEVRDAAKKAGVKVAFLGETCYSGHFLELADEKTCVVTATQKDKLGVITSTRALTSELTKQKNRNLEQAFLSARKNDFSPSQPLISTAENERVMATLSFLREYLSTTVSLSEESEIVGERHFCQNNGMLPFSEQLEGLRAQSHLVSSSIKDFFSKILSSNSDSGREFISKLEHDMERYAKSRHTLEYYLRQFQGRPICKPLPEDLRTGEEAEFCYHNPIYLEGLLDQLKTRRDYLKDSTKLTEVKVLNNIEKFIPFFESLTQTPEFQDRLQKLGGTTLSPAETFAKIMLFAKFNKNVHLKDLNFPKLEDVNTNLALETSPIIKAERELYDKIYMQDALSKDRKSNACRDFKL